MAIMNEVLRQAYDAQGNQIVGKGLTEQESFSGLLHGASHLWVWRKVSTGVQVLLQRRSLTKSSWPGLLDISAAGHIDLGEDPITAMVRETILTHQREEVAEVTWVPLEEFEHAWQSTSHVPHGTTYCDVVLKNITWSLR